MAAAAAAAAAAAMQHHHYSRPTTSASSLVAGASYSSSLAALTAGISEVSPLQQQQNAALTSIPSLIHPTAIKQENQAGINVMSPNREELISATLANRQQQQQQLSSQRELLANSWLSTLNQHVGASALASLKALMQSNEGGGSLQQTQVIASNAAELSRISQPQQQPSAEQLLAQRLMAAAGHPSSATTGLLMNATSDVDVKPSPPSSSSSSLLQPSSAAAAAAAVAALQHQHHALLMMAESGSGVAMKDQSIESGCSSVGGGVGAAVQISGTTATTPSTSAFTITATSGGGSSSSSSLTSMCAIAAPNATLSANATAAAAAESIPRKQDIQTDIRMNKGRFQLVRKRGRSEVWNLFGQVVDTLTGNRLPYVACYACKVLYTDTGGGTGNMTRHRCSVGNSYRSIAGSSTDTISESINTQSSSFESVYNLTANGPPSPAAYHMDAANAFASGTNQISGFHWPEANNAYRFYEFIASQQQQQHNQQQQQLTVVTLRSQHASFSSSAAREAFVRSANNSGSGSCGTASSGFISASLSSIGGTSCSFGGAGGGGPTANVMAHSAAPTMPTTHHPLLLSSSSADSLSSLMSAAATVAGQQQQPQQTMGTSALAQHFVQQQQQQQRLHLQQQQLVPQQQQQGLLLTSMGRLAAAAAASVIPLMGAAGDTATSTVSLRRSVTPTPFSAQHHASSLPSTTRALSTTNASTLAVAAAPHKSASTTALASTVSPRQQHHQAKASSSGNGDGNGYAVGPGHVFTAADKQLFAHAVVQFCAQDLNNCDVVEGEGFKNLVETVLFIGRRSSHPGSGQSATAASADGTAASFDPARNLIPTARQMRQVFAAQERHVRHATAADLAAARRVGVVSLSVQHFRHADTDHLRAAVVYITDDWRLTRRSLAVKKCEVALSLRTADSRTSAELVRFVNYVLTECCLDGGGGGMSPMRVLLAVDASLDASAALTSLSDNIVLIRNANCALNQILDDCIQECCGADTREAIGALIGLCRRSVIALNRLNSLSDTLRAAFVSQLNEDDAVAVGANTSFPDYTDGVYTTLKFIDENCEQIRALFERENVEPQLCAELSAAAEWRRLAGQLRSLLEPFHETTQILNDTKHPHFQRILPEWHALIHECDEQSSAASADETETEVDVDCSVSSSADGYRRSCTPDASNHDSKEKNYAIPPTVTVFEPEKGAAQSMDANTRLRVASSLSASSSNASSTTTVAETPLPPLKRPPSVTVSRRATTATDDDPVMSSFDAAEDVVSRFAVLSSKSLSVISAMSVDDDPLPSTSTATDDNEQFAETTASIPPYHRSAQELELDATVAESVQPPQNRPASAASSGDGSTPRRRRRPLVAQMAQADQLPTHNTTASFTFASSSSSWLTRVRRSANRRLQEWARDNVRVEHRIATALNPRMKHLNVICTHAERSEVYARIREMVGLAAGEADSGSTSSRRSCGSGGGGAGGGGGAPDEPPARKRREFLDRLEECAPEDDDELDVYLRTSFPPNLTRSILEFWSSFGENEFPRLARLARFMLGASGACPALIAQRPSATTTLETGELSTLLMLRPEVLNTLQRAPSVERSALFQQHHQLNFRSHQPNQHQHGVAAQHQHHSR